MVIFDTNMILRYLLNDQPETAQRAERCLEEGHVLVTIEVIAEVVCVLNSVYAIEREKISGILQAFLKYVNYRDSDILDLAVRAYGEHKLDFVDCVLYAYYKIDGTEIETSNQTLRRLMTEKQ